MLSDLMDLEKKDITEIVKETGLKHIAIIMDGNRRWAKEKHLPSPAGHQRGAASLKNIVKACHSFGVEYLTVYAFSVENHKRSQDEVGFLMNLLVTTLKKELAEMNDNGVRIKFLGNIDELSPELIEVIRNSEETTKNNTGVKLQIAFNYGGREEIVNAAKKLAQKVKNSEIAVEDINTELFEKNLYAEGSVPSPDLLIRTGGEKRISNFLLWQLSYSEIYVTDEYWPEFDKHSLGEAIREFEKRNRRYGK